MADWTEKVDFGKTADDYARHRAGFPGSFFQRISDLGIARPGLRALDLGTGTGTVARGLAQLGLSVTGLDPSDDLTAQARALDAAAGVEIDYVTAKAEDTGQPEGHFDLVTAGQCWHWFEHEIGKKGGEGREGNACFEAQAAKQENPESSRERKGWQSSRGWVPRVLPSWSRA